MTEAKHSIDLDDTSSMESESFLENQQISTPRRPKPILYWLWHTVLFCLATGWVIPLTRSYHKANAPMGKTPLPAEVFQRVKKTFQPDQRFVGGSNATHHAWDGLVAGHDALYIQNPDEYGLPKGTFPSFDHPGKIGKGPAKFYVVTVLHQMHCLNIIRFHYWQVKGVTPATPGYSESSWEVHLDHCFEYLRQAISCGSAFDIEGSSPLADPGEKGHIASTVTGWGVEHNCIDFEALRNFQIDQEKLYNSTWQGHSH